jgi:prophage DNA circulation protein
MGSQLGQMALALVNATLMLAVLLIFGLWLLLGRAQDFAADTARAAAGVVGSELGEKVAERAASLDAALANLTTLEARLGDAIARAGTADGPAVTELAALRTDIRALTSAVDGLAKSTDALRDHPAEAVSDLFSQILQGLATRLGPPQLPPT